VKAKHIPTGQIVAIKKVSHVFNNVVDAKRLLREVIILHKMGPNKNVVKLIDVLEPTNNPSNY
jgi:mitogen-activated protein kinase 1/3